MKTAEGGTTEKVGWNWRDWVVFLVTVPLVFFSATFANQWIAGSGWPIASITIGVFTLATRRTVSSRISDTTAFGWGFLIAGFVMTLTIVARELFVL